MDIREKTQDDRVWIEEFIEKAWGGNPLVIRGVSYYPHNLPGFIAFEGDLRLGLLSYEVRGAIAEIIVLDVFDKFKGIGTKLLDALKEKAKTCGCRQIYLMTTNDNIDAMRFYQRRGFVLSGIHVDSVKLSRAIKPTIAAVGDYNIPVRDEIDLTLDLFA